MVTEVPVPLSVWSNSDLTGNYFNSWIQYKNGKKYVFSLLILWTGAASARVGWNNGQPLCWSLSKLSDRTKYTTPFWRTKFIAYPGTSRPHKECRLSFLQLPASRLGMEDGSCYIKYQILPALFFIKHCPEGCNYLTKFQSSKITNSDSSCQLTSCLVEGWIPGASYLVPFSMTCNWLLFYHFVDNCSFFP